MNKRIKKKHKKLMGCSYKTIMLMGIKKKLSKKTFVESIVDVVCLYDYQKYIARYLLSQGIDCKTETISIIRK